MSSKNTSNTPGIKNIINILGMFLHVPRLQRQITRLEELTKENTHKLSQLDGANQKLDEITDKFTYMQISLDNLQQKIDFLETNNKTVKSLTKDTVSAKLFANDHMLDKFYGDFEDRFRGSEDMIYDRLSEYVPVFKEQKIDYAKSPVLDIGSGRGELLKLLKDSGINAIGLDINKEMVERSIKMGYKASEGDAELFLKNSKSQSFGAITGFHIVEHIPFNVLLRIFNNCYRALVADGFVIFETPNPENLKVGSTTFYMDPSHLHPLPPDLLAFTLQTIGFRNVEIRRLHPETDKMNDSLPKEVNNLLYGPRDYSVIGYK